jgi:hypothetical protein
VKREVILLPANGHPLLDYSHLHLNYVLESYNSMVFLSMFQATCACTLGCPLNDDVLSTISVSSVPGLHLKSAFAIRYLIFQLNVISINSDLISLYFEHRPLIQAEMSFLLRTSRPVMAPALAAVRPVACRPFTAGSVKFLKENAGGMFFSELR